MRALTPEDACGLPQLIIFSDGSKVAYGAVAYCRWQLTNGEFKSYLIMAKSKIAPLKTVNIVRLELSGAVISKRIRTYIEKEINLRFEKVYHMVDSEIMKAMIDKESYGFNTFIANRIGEIHQETSPKEWVWVSGKQNIADILTRGCKPEEMNEDSTWQTGPTFLERPEKEWPIRTHTIVTVPLDRHLKGEIKKNHEHHTESTQSQVNISTRCNHTTNPQINQNDSLAKRLNIERFSSFKKLIRVTARVLSMYKPPSSFKNAVQYPKLPLFMVAESFWFKEAQRLITDDDLKTRYVRLSPYRHPDGIIVVGRRAEKWMNISYNKEALILLPYNHPVARLYTQQIHIDQHLCGYTGSSATTSKVRLKVWIVKLERMVKSIKQHCVTCRKINKRPENQIMGQLPIDRLKPAPAWHSVSLDYFGPFEIRGEVNKRARGKAYGVIFSCNLSRAVHIEIADSYNMDSFLTVLRRFIVLRGSLYHPIRLWATVN